MKKNISPYILSAIFIAVAIILIAVSVNEEEGFSSACFEEACFELEVVDTPEERMKGLMYREYLPEDAGMLFIFDENGIYPFWMKNTLISLDMIWIDENLKVVYIEHNALPCTQDPCESFNPQAEAKYVLEINGGLSERHNISVGQKVRFK